MPRPTYTVRKGGVSLLVDSGANVECKPNNLLEYGAMGAYISKVSERGIFSQVGSEEPKAPPSLSPPLNCLPEASEFIGM